MDERWVGIDTKNEPKCRAWLLEHADTLDLTLVDNSEYSHTSFFGLVVCKQVVGKIVDANALETFRSLEPWFLRHETNNLMYGGYPQGKKTKVDHYYFSLSNEIKEILNRQTLFWDGFDGQSLLRGFEDPVFLKNGVMIGNVISHEYEGVLYPGRVETPENPWLFNVFIVDSIDLF